MSKKLTYDFVKEQINNEGYQLLSKQYINNHTKLKIQCLKGHIYDVNWNNFKNGKRCPICYQNNKAYKYSYVKKQIESVDGYKLLSKQYINTDTKLEIQCSQGHIFYMRYRNFQTGQRCPICNNLNKSKRQRLNYDYVKGQFEKEGYKLLSKKYKRNNLQLDIQCPEGHIYKQSYASFYMGHRCSECFELNKYSKGEKEVYEYIKSIINEEIIENDRTQIINPETGYNLELDIWIPSLNKAIEYNGDYWHSLKYKKHKDKIKQQQCKEKGIDLLVIKEEDWITNKSICINNIIQLFTK